MRMNRHSLRVWRWGFGGECLIHHSREGMEALPYDNGLDHTLTVVVPPSNPFADWIPPQGGMMR